LQLNSLATFARRATDFEFHHRNLLHLLLTGLGVSTYFLSPDDIVWAIVRHHSDSATLERGVFGAGTLMFLFSAALETWPGAAPTRFPLLFSRLLLALGVGLLVPLAGTIVLIGGELFLVVRLYVRERENSPTDKSAGRAWRNCFRQAFSKWALAASMLIFTLALRDRIAEIGAAISLAIGLILNPRSLIGSRDAHRP
jgi:hypothetical protein